MCIGETTHVVKLDRMTSELLAVRKAHLISTITIRFDSKFRIRAQLFDSIRNEKNTIRTTLFSCVDNATAYDSSAIEIVFTYLRHVMLC